MPDFFAGVPERIPFGGLDSDDPFSFKVYQPDRVVAGRSMADHLRVAVCMWHSFNWPGSDVFGSGTFDRPWLQPRAGRHGGGACPARGSVRVLRQAGRAVLHASTTATSRPRAARFAESTASSMGAVDVIEEQMAANRRASCCGARPTCSRTPATWPARPPTRIPRCSPTPRRRSRRCSRSPSASAAPTTSCGAAAKATRRCSTPT